MSLMNTEKYEEEQHKDIFFLWIYLTRTMRGLKDIPAIIISRHNLNKIHYTNNTVLIEDTDRKL